jgi:hypothetical protein
VPRGRQLQRGGGYHGGAGGRRCCICTRHLIVRHIIIRHITTKKPLILLREISGFEMVAGTGFEPVTFGL